MQDASLLNAFIAVTATGGALFVIIWLFAAPVEKSKARGLGMMIGSIGYFIFGSRDDGDGGGEA